MMMRGFSVVGSPKPKSGIAIEQRKARVNQRGARCPRSCMETKAKVSTKRLATVRLTVKENGTSVIIRPPQLASPAPWVRGPNHPISQTHFPLHTLRIFGNINTSRLL